jgi:hypothetical protein
MVALDKCFDIKTLRRLEVGMACQSRPTRVVNVSRRVDFGFQRLDENDFNSGRR